MNPIDEIRDRIAEPAKDVRLNLQAVLQPGSLSPSQRWGVALASAAASRNAALLDAVVRAARREVEPAVVEDAIAAATLMAMNNVYYRFRHLVGKPAYATKPARLRMNRMVNPATNKVDFELFSLAVSAVNACETCIQAHEKVVVEGGLTEDQVHDAVRIAATIASAAVALETASVVAEAASPIAAEA